MEKELELTTEENLIRAKVLEYIEINGNCLSYIYNEQKKYLKNKDVKELFHKMVEINQFLVLSIESNNIKYVITKQKEALFEAINKIENFNNIINPEKKT
tara:strand:+ start:21128 stop:21427 length:300 start_codon:yes stop_codon:yes gene_type:complete